MPSEVSARLGPGMIPVVNTTRSSSSAGRFCPMRRASDMSSRSAFIKLILGVSASRNVRPTMVTWAPRAAMSLERARQIPPVPPTTTTRFPERSRLSGDTGFHVRFLFGTPENLDIALLISFGNDHTYNTLVMDFAHDWKGTKIGAVRYWQIG